MKLNKEQVEVLNITQQVMRAMLLAIAAVNPAALPQVGALLRSASMHEDLEPMSQHMLSDLAEGVETLTGTGVKPAAH